jgi:hypothetical protein
MSETAIARHGNHGLAQQQTGLVFSQQLRQTIRQTVASGITKDDQFLVFMAYCERKGLDPLQRHIYGWTDKTGKLVMATGIDGFRHLGGQRARVNGLEIAYCGEDEVWRSIWVRKELPVACRCQMWIAGSSRAFEAVIYLKEFFMEFNPNWKQRPLHMLAVRAEAHCWRKIPQAGIGDLDLMDEGQAIPGTSRIIEEQPAQLQAPAPDPAYADLPEKDQVRVFNETYIAAGGDPKNRAALLQHIGAALGENFRALNQVTPAGKERFVQLLQQRGCLPGDTNWPLASEVVEDEDQFAGDAGADEPVETGRLL